MQSKFYKVMHFQGVKSGFCEGFFGGRKSWRELIWCELFDVLEIGLNSLCYDFCVTKEWKMGVWMRKF